MVEEAAAMTRPAQALDGAVEDAGSSTFALTCPIDQLGPRPATTELSWERVLYSELTQADTTDSWQPSRTFDTALIVDPAFSCLRQSLL